MRLDRVRRKRRSTDSVTDGKLKGVSEPLDSVLDSCSMETQAGGRLLPKVRQMGAVCIECKLDFLKRLFSKYLEVNGVWRVQERVVGEMFLGLRIFLTVRIFLEIRKFLGL